MSDAKQGDQEVSLVLSFRDIELILGALAASGAAKGIDALAPVVWTTDVKTLSALTEILKNTPLPYARVDSFFRTVGEQIRTVAAA